VKVLPGEYFVASEDIPIMTTLGSCIAACLCDRQAGVGGLNHFLLPDGDDGSGGRYGAYAMELLINAMMKRGASRSSLEAKVFGGGQVLAGMTRMNIGERNTRFVLEYLRTERIPLISKDVLDIYPRKVCFLPASGQALVKRLAAADTATPGGAGTAGGAAARAGRRRWRLHRPVLTLGTTGTIRRRGITQMTRTRVVVVDDSALVRSLLAEIINRQPDMQCVGAAADPLLAREMIRELEPDVITLDVEMPRMDGLEFLARLMRLRPMPVVMVSTLTEQGAEVTLRALELGAVDFVAKPRIGVADGLKRLAEDITDKIRTAARAQMCAGPPRRAAPPPPRPVRAPRRAGAPVDREDHLRRRLHRRHRGDARTALRPAGRRAGGADHPAHAARLHPQLCRAGSTACAASAWPKPSTANARCPGTPTSPPAACT
jgi:chemotaxis receptor (MCP) glutamine deamidase CheD/CheY-like chemotaxis protein